MNAVVKKLMWSAAPVSAYLRRGPSGYFRSECCAGDETMAAQRVKHSLHPPINTEHEAGQAASISKYSLSEC